jgi:RNA polymerase sigma-70 factor (ECF subfamily)
MAFQAARLPARVDRHGEMVLLEDQDRSLWDQKEIQEGLELVQQALRQGRVGPYQFQAAIASLHAEAQTAAETDWKQIAALYRELMRINHSPIIALNHAAAVAMSQGAEQGLLLMDAVGNSGKLDNYYLFHAARADLLRRLQRLDESLSAYLRAIELTTNEVEKQYMRKRIKEMSDESIH